MSEISIKSVAKRALGETAEAVRWNKPVPIVLALVTALAALSVTFWVTGDVAWSAFAGLGATALFFPILFMCKVVTVPLAIAKEASARADAAQAELAERRDPDGIYQHGVQVGTVRLPEIEPSRSTAQFAEIFNAVEFDVAQPFEYRNWVLKLIGFDGLSTTNASGVRGRSLYGVRATIISRR